MIGAVGWVVAGAKGTISTESSVGAVAVFAVLVLLVSARRQRCRSAGTGFVRQQNEKMAKQHLGLKKQKVQGDKTTQPTLMSNMTPNKES